MVAPAPPAASRKTPWDVLLPVLGAIGTGIGVLGFVTFFGGAIIWTRAEALHLPAFETVGLLPTSVLITTGAHFLVGAALLAVLAVSLLYVYNFALEEPVKRRAAAKAKDAAAKVEAAKDRKKDAAANVNDAREELSSKQKAADLAEDLDAASPTTESKAALIKARKDVDDAKEALAVVQKSEKVAAKELEKLERAARPDFAKQKVEIARLASLAVPLLALELVAMTSGALAWYSYLLLVAISLATIAISLVIFYETGGRFIWFGVAAFLSVSLFVGVATYFRTRDAPKAEPAAALVGTKAIAGYFVAQTSDRLYLGEPPRASLPGRLVALDRSKVTALAIGPLTPTKDSLAFNAARAMAISICHQVSPAAAGATPQRGCPSIPSAPALTTP